MDYETKFRNTEKHLRKRKDITHKYAVDELAAVVKKADDELDSVKTHAIAYIFTALAIGLVGGFILRGILV